MNLAKIQSRCFSLCGQGKSIVIGDTMKFGEEINLAGFGQCSNCSFARIHKFKEETLQNEQSESD